MKFVYHSANKEDLKDLYKRVLNAGLKLPLKPFDATHVSSKLLRPLAVYDYTRYHDPKKVYWPSIEEKEQHQTAMTTTDFHPTITDIDICSSYNTRSVMDVFKQDAVIAFHETFESSKKNITLKDASFKEYTFLIDTQKRRQYPYNKEDDSRFIARFVLTTFLFVSQSLKCGWLFQCLYQHSR